MFDKITQDIFLKNWSEATRAGKRLETSLSRLGTQFPLKAEQLLSNQEELLEGLDAFRVKFEKFVTPLPVTTLIMKRNEPKH